jgi:hypothetical protein
MANPEHLAILKLDVEAWNEWREGNPHVMPDLSDADLSDAHLRLANLHRAHLSDADLSRADLIHANLIDADLSGANLSGAKLSGVKLGGADLYAANLSGADLNYANLFAADLSRAELSGADLNSAHLTFAYLTDAHLKSADLTDAHMSGTSIANTDLSDVIGLDTVTHGGPSSIGIDTLYKSHGKIPESFLRGCGVPEELIRYLPSFLNQPIQFYSCFISYSHEDKAFARLLHDRLQGQGIRCWLDEHQLLPGDDLHDRVDQGIRLWDKVLLCATKSSLTSWWVDGEINRAFQKEAQIMKERQKKALALIPLNLDGSLFSADYQSGKKAEITSRVAANFVGWEKDHALFDRELEKVIRALRTDDAGREKPPPPKL